MESAMKTPYEIKKWLECCTHVTCNGCPYDEDGCATSQQIIDALEYIQQLERRIGELAEKVAQIDHVTRERDALLEIVKELGECNYCKHNSYCPHTIPDCMNCKDGNCQCYSCGHQSKWQWSGVQEGE